MRTAHSPSRRPRPQQSRGGAPQEADGAPRRPRPPPQGLRLHLLRPERRGVPGDPAGPPHHRAPALRHPAPVGAPSAAQRRRHRQRDPAPRVPCERPGRTDGHDAAALRLQGRRPRRGGPRGGRAPLHAAAGAGGGRDAAEPLDPHERPPLRRVLRRPRTHPHPPAGGGPPSAALDLQRLQPRDGTAHRRLQPLPGRRALPAGARRRSRPAQQQGAGGGRGCAGPHGHGAGQSGGGTGGARAATTAAGRRPPELHSAPRHPPQLRQPAREPHAALPRPPAGRPRPPRRRQGGDAAVLRHHGLRQRAVGGGGAGRARGQKRRQRGGGALLHLPPQTGRLRLCLEDLQGGGAAPGAVPAPQPPGPPGPRPPPPPQGQESPPEAGRGVAGPGGAPRGPGGRGAGGRTAPGPRPLLRPHRLRPRVLVRGGAGLGRREARRGGFRGALLLLSPQTRRLRPPLPRPEGRGAPGRVGGRRPRKEGAAGDRVPAQTQLPGGADPEGHRLRELLLQVTLLLLVPVDAAGRDAVLTPPPPPSRLAGPAPPTPPPPPRPHPVPWSPPPPPPPKGGDVM